MISTCLRYTYSRGRGEGSAPCGGNWLRLVEHSLFIGKLVKWPFLLFVYSCTSWLSEVSFCINAGIFKQSIGARNRVGIGLSYRPARLVHRANGVDSLESILWLLKSLKIRANQIVTGLFENRKILLHDTNIWLGSEKGLLRNLANNKNYFEL